MRAQVFAGGAQAREARFDTVGLYFYTRGAPAATDLLCTNLSPDGNGTSYSTVQMVLLHGPAPHPFSLPLSEVVVASGAGSCTPDWLGPVQLKKVIGPLRLGVTIKAGALHYAWFADAGTETQYHVAGVQYFAIPFTDPPARVPYIFATADLGASNLIVGQGTMMQFAAVVQASLTPGVEDDSTFTHTKFENFQADDGSGAVAVTIGEATEYNWQLRVNSALQFNGGPRFGAPFRHTVDLACDETSGGAVAADATLEGTRTCPTSFVVSKPFVGLAGQVATSNYSTAEEGHVLTAAVLADPWLSAQDVTPYVADRPFRFEGQSPLDPQLATPTDYSTGSVTIASPVSVLQSASAWAVDLGTVAVGGTPTVPVFTVTATPAIVRREFLSYWRLWNTSGDPRFHSEDGYRTTKTAYYSDTPPPDVFGFSAYSYLDVDMTVPGGDPTSLAIVVSWAVHRGTSTIDTITTTYSPIVFPAGGRSAQRVDLMFPTAMLSRPYYGERVDSIQLVGLLAGVTTLHSISLVADEDAYFTASGRKATLRDGSTAYTGLVLSQDGSAPSLLFGRDTVLSPAGDLDLDGWQDYKGDHQNGAFVVNQVTQEHPGAAPAMFQSTLETAIEELHRLEGITAAYDGAPILAALTDGDGNVAGTDSAGNPATVIHGGDWFLPTLPADRIAAGVAYDVRAQFVFSGVTIPAGVNPANMRVFQRNHLGAVLEALATDADYFRRPAGVTVTASAYTGGAPASGDLVLGAEDTDASGFAIIGVRTGQVDGAEFNAILS
jgi:hypothetical protein